MPEVVLSLRSTLRQVCCLKELNLPHLSRLEKRVWPERDDDDSDNADADSDYTKLAAAECEIREGSAGRADDWKRLT